jgi:hypothetical protein
MFAVRIQTGNRSRAALARGGGVLTRLGRRFAVCHDHEADICWNACRSRLLRLNLRDSRTGFGIIDVNEITRRTLHSLYRPLRRAELPSGELPRRPRSVVANRRLFGCESRDPGRGDPLESLEPPVGPGDAGPDARRGKRDGPFLGKAAPDGSGGTPGRIPYPARRGVVWRGASVGTFMRKSLPSTARPPGEGGRKKKPQGKPRAPSQTADASRR